jgi:transcriptional antiterminator RfaH
MLTFALLRNRMQQKNIQTHWFLLYTKPRAEKRVAVELQHKGYEVFLPLQRTLKVWSDRKKWVEEPLFKSYLFIRTQLEANFYNILNTAGVVKFISFQSTPAIVDPSEIRLVKMLLGEYSDLVPSNQFENCNREIDESRQWGEGEEVIIIAGPLSGTIGKLITIRTGKKMLIELQSIKQNILVTIPQHFLNKTNSLNLQAL